MIEFFSNFFLISKENENELYNKTFLLPKKIYNINKNNIDTILNIAISDYKNLHTVVIVYNDSHIIRTFLYSFLKQYVKISDIHQCEDILITNKVIFL